MARLDLDDYLPYLLNRAGSRIAVAFGRVIRRHGITLPMWRVLAALNQRDGQSIGELSAMTSIGMSTLSRLLDQMQARRLVRRHRGAADLRSVAVHRTAAAAALTARLIPLARRYEAQALVGLDEPQIGQLKALLRQLYDNMDGLDEIGD